MQIVHAMIINIKTFVDKSSSVKLPSLRDTLLKAAVTNFDKCFLDTDQVQGYGMILLWIFTQEILIKIMSKVFKPLSLNNNN